MQQKVTNYEISKRLDELGFECESHCGWWLGLLQEDLKTYKWVYAIRYKCEDDGDIKMKYKAYGCWDLLMWFRKQQRQISNINFTNSFMQIRQEFFDVEFYDTHREKEKRVHCPDEDHPQNALAKAIIKILEERQ